MTAYLAVELAVLIAVLGLIGAILLERAELQRAHRALERQRDEATQAMNRLTEKLKAVEKARAAAASDPAALALRVKSVRPPRSSGVNGGDQP